VFDRLETSIGRIIAETAGAFAAADVFPLPDWMAIPRLPDLGILRCSQKNIGDRHEMICNLSVGKSEWQRLIGACEDEAFCLDALCEMANCVCGSLLADAAFADAFGFLIPCVPCAGYCQAGADSATCRGAFRLGGAWIHYAISVQAAAGILSSEATLAA
jgi:hypothetical protein